MGEKTPRGMLDGPGDGSEQSDHSDHSDQSDRSEMSRPGGKRPREGSPNHSQCSLREMCKCVYSKLGADVAQALPVKAHKSAVSTMTQIQELLVDRVQRGEAQTPRDVRMYLLYSGVALRRRLLLTKLSDIDKSDLRTTLALLFVLQLLCHGHAPTPSGDSGNLEHGLEVLEATAGETESDAIEQWKRAPLEDIVNSQSGWQTDSATVCQSCLSIGPRLCTSMTTTVAVAEVFFRCSADMLRYSMLEAMQPSDSFLRLDSVDFLIRANRSSQNLSSIVELAESEAGQTLLRDLILSFTLPQNIVGVRRTGILSRESNHLATERHPKLLNNAHEAAMRGATWEYQQNPSDTVKACCILAGLAIVFMSRKSDVRKDDAFDGRVLLPFLETKQPPRTTTRLILLPTLNEWAVFSVDNHGKPVVHMRDAGIDGLGQCVLLLCKEHRRSQV